MHAIHLVGQEKQKHVALEKSESTPAKGPTDAKRLSHALSSPLLSQWEEG
jgi:hypothetical protein